MLSHEIENLDRLAITVKVEDVNKAVELIEKADRVLVLGCMASASLATHMGCMLCKIMPELDVVDSDGFLKAAKFLRLAPDSVYRCNRGRWP